MIFPIPNINGPISPCHQSDPDFRYVLYSVAKLEDAPPPDTIMPDFPDLAVQSVVHAIARHGKCAHSAGSIRAGIVDVIRGKQRPMWWNVINNQGGEPMMLGGAAPANFATL